MLRLTIEDDTGRVREHLDATIEAMTDLRPALATVGDALLDRFAANLDSQGARLADRGVRWPPLHPATLAIRSHYGHPSGPPLDRTGERALRSSLRTEAPTATSVDIVARHPAADLVDRGGRNRDGRPIPARPFLVPSHADADDLAGLLLDQVIPS
ncbi:MAG: phage virion morphogenesis protein [Acidobacteriota bacterium]